MILCKKIFVVKIVSVDAMSLSIDAKVPDSVDDPKANERFHAFPRERLEAVATVSGFVGVASGFYQGIKLSSLRYLTENGHRLPRTVGGWYFYHKKKNYVMILAGVKKATQLGLKYSLGITSFFGLEFLFDKYVRANTIDFMNTTVSAAIMSLSYAKYQGLSRVQTKNFIFKGSFMGLCLGLSQDFLICKRGGYIWYLDRLDLLQKSKSNLSSMSI